MAGAGYSASLSSSDQLAATATLSGGVKFGDINYGEPSSIQYQTSKAVPWIVAGLVALYLLKKYKGA